jgi:hypothetical protein
MASRKRHWRQRKKHQKAAMSSVSQQETAALQDAYDFS